MVRDNRSLQRAYHDRAISYLVNIPCKQRVESLPKGVSENNFWVSVRWSQKCYMN